MEKIMVCYNDLCELGFPPNQARRIIKEAKTRLVLDGYGFYNGKRVGLVPTSTVKEIIGLSPDEGKQ